MAEQFPVDPPFNPVQVQFHGPLPETVEAVPALQRFELGALKKPCPFDEPHVPLTSRLAEQFALDPPLDPVQIQLHGPLPETEDAVPALQRFELGALKKSCPFDEPHAPLTSRLAEQFALVPPFTPAQVQLHGPLPETEDAVPALQRFELGALKKPCPFDEPHAPLTSRLAEQFALDPPLDPVQVQLHGPDPETVDAVPALQRFELGALKKPCPFDEPHAPLTSRLAEQFALDPPLDPVQVQLHGPLPVSAEAVPALQKFELGAVVKLCPFDEPHAPLTSRLAEQFALVPPFDPVQVQFHGPVPVSVEAEPALQRFELGALKKSCPFDEPHAPLTSRLAEQLAVDPPFDPVQVQFHGPVPVTVEAVPALQKFELGAVVKLCPFDEPHAPLTSRLAEQLALDPPFDPVQVQLHGPDPVTVEAVPAPQRFELGAVVKPCPFDEPQVPLTSRLAEQLALEPPFDPVQVQFHGPVPASADAVPVLQRFELGAVVKPCPFDEPHAPLTSRLAEQFAVDPPFTPAHVQLHGPLPVTADAVPVLQRFELGALKRLCPFDEPHAPLPSRLAEQFTVDPPFDPAQVQLHGPDPETVEAVPVLQRFELGGLKKLCPFDEPHAPPTSRLAEQLALEPPFTPAQVQFHGPVPVSAEAVPVLQRLELGALKKLCPFAEPQVPLSCGLAEQLAVDPPPDPAQDQPHGPVPVRAVAVPALQRFEVGALKKFCPFAEPQAPFTIELAEQFAVDPPIDPAQVQLHGPVPVTADAVPVLQRFELGGLRKLCPFDEPHAPLTPRLAEQLTIAPPFNPAQVQFHGPVPVTAETVPVPQRFELGAAV